MGNVCGKQGKGKVKDKAKESQDKYEKSSTKHEEVDPTLEDLANIPDSAEEFIEEEEMTYLRETLHKNLGMFVLNHVLMSVQFFKNFDEEVGELRDEAKKSEGKFIEGTRMRVYKTDTLMDRLGSRIIFRARHGPNKNKESLLHPIKSYLVYENVNVEERVVSKDASREIPPFYNLAVESPESPSLQAAGYVNLREVNKKEEEVIYASLTNESGSPPRSDDEDEDDLEELRIRMQNRTTLSVSTSSEYGYTTIQKITATKYIDEARQGLVPQSNCSLASHCFKQVQRQILNNARRTGKIGPLTTSVTYVDSEQFVKHFLDVFAEHLQERLHLGSTNAIVQASRIIIKDRRATLHLSPVFATTWWPDCSMSFMKPEEGEYPWPTKRLQKRIEKQGAFLLPQGYMLRRGDNPEYHLQWRFIHPRAEQLLLLHTMHSHIRCYLFTLAIFKSYLHDEETPLAVDHTHILHLLFREIQKNFIGWPDDRPGETLIRFLSVLYKRLKKRKIRNFFIRDRNLLHSCPNIFLNRTLGTLKKILDNPLPHVIAALRNIRFLGTDTIDFVEVYKLATTVEILQHLNPLINPYKGETKTNVTVKIKDDNDTERIWQLLRHQQLEEQKTIQKALENAKRISVDTIDLEKEVVNDTDKEEIKERRIEILVLFLVHFNNTAKRCRENRSYEQAFVYLQQSKRLNKLLAEENHDVEIIDSFNKTISVEWEKCTMEQQESESGTKRKEVVSLPDESKSEGFRLSVHIHELPEVPT